MCFLKKRKRTFVCGNVCLIVGVMSEAYKQTLGEYAGTRGGCSLFFPSCFDYIARGGGEENPFQHDGKP